MIALIAGEEKTGKTRFALTFPKKIAYFEFDLGGFDRGILGFSDAERKLIIDNTAKYEFPSPLQMEFKDRSLLETIKLTGEQERWQSFVSTYNTCCMDVSIKTIIFDTWFQVYELARQAYLQILQEAQLDPSGNLRRTEEKLRESLQQVEYTQPYAKLRSVMFYAKAKKKNLVLVTYDADEYKQQLNGRTGKIESVATGKKIPAGWKETEKHADIALWTSIVGNNPEARITLPGIAPLNMVGTVIPDNSYDTLMKVLSI